MTSRLATVLALVALVLLLAADYSFWRYGREQATVESIARSIPLTGSRTDQARQLGFYIRNRVDYNGAQHDDRPFLRASALHTLSTGKGYCGEATRAYIALARAKGISARRALLYGSVNHVVPEVEVAPGRWVLIDIQKNPATNPILDPRPLPIDSILIVANSPFRRVSNLNVLRIPVIGESLEGIRFKGAGFAWVLENPSLMVGGSLAGLSTLLAPFALVARLRLGKRNDESAG